MTTVRAAGFLALALCSTALTGCGDPVEPLPAEVMVDITTGYSHSCALTEQGTAYCWGRGYSGELGENSTTVRWDPVRVRVDEPLQQLTAGYFHTCGLARSGTAYCWGWNSYGQVGIGGGEESVLSPAAVSGGHAFSALSAGWYHTCGLTTGGQVLCWGRNADGALGDGTAEDRPVPTPVDAAVTFDAVAAAAHHTCGLSGGQALCWGRNTEGQLGDGTTERRLAPTPVQGGLQLSAIDGGRAHTCGLSGSAIHCWGSNGRGELGTGRTGVLGIPGSTVPVRVAREQAYVAVGAGADYTCALDDGAVGYCWGAASHGQLGIATTVDRNYPTVVRTRGFTMLSPGPGTHTCGTDTARRPSCWGTGFLGQLGLEETTYTPVPATVTQR